ncbi:MAG: ribonuclease Z [Prolixibacteraceae bacterium]|jgi:ribonuclease Z|nr:ribonuclease Z [Prolixibacteraceae bacterium]
MSFELTILGSNSALPTSNRYPTAQVLTVPGRFFLIDCGEGAQMQLRKNRISLSKIDHILISHTHGDHIFGLIGLISTMVLLGRKKDLHIFSHSELQKFIQFQLDFLYPKEIPFRLVFHPLSFRSPQTIYQDKRLSITSFPLKHRIATCGFLFQETAKLPNLKKNKIEEYNIPIRDRQRIKEGADFILPDGKIIPHSELITPAKRPCSYAFCSDTAYHEEIVETIRGVDLLYHEATFAEDNNALAAETFHSTGRQAATIARKAEVKKLIIGHFSARYKTSSVILEEAREIFPGTYAVEDGDVFKITGDA